MEREGKQKELRRVGLGRRGRSKEKKGRRLEWKGEVKERNYSIIIIVIIREGREGLSKGREL